MSHQMPISNLSNRIWSVPFDWSIGQIYVNSVDIADASLMAFINDFNEPRWLIKWVTGRVDFHKDVYAFRKYSGRSFQSASVCGISRGTLEPQQICINMLKMLWTIVQLNSTCTQRTPTMTSTQISSGLRTFLHSNRAKMIWGKRKWVG